MKMWIRTRSFWALIFESGLPSPDYLWKYESGLDPHVVIYFISGPSPSGPGPNAASGMEFTTSIEKEVDNATVVDKNH